MSLKLDYFNPLKNLVTLIEKGADICYAMVVCLSMSEMPENQVCDSCRKELSNLKNDSKYIITENCQGDIQLDVSDTFASLFNESFKESLKPYTVIFSYI